MSKFGKGAIWFVGVIWAVLAAAATIPAKQAVSNLQGWAEILGLTALVQPLAHKWADYLVQLAAVIIGAWLGVLIVFRLQLALHNAMATNEDYRRVFGTEPPPSTVMSYLKSLLRR